MSRRGTNIYYRAKEKRWEGRIVIGKTDTGKTRYKSVYGKTCKEVREKMDKYRAEMLLGTATLPSAGKFKLVSSAWLESIRTEIKESSYNKYNNTLNNYILPTLANKDLSKIKSSDIEELVRMLRTSGRKNGEGLASSTISQVIIILKKIKEFASKKGYAVNYSTDDIKVKKEKKEARVFSSDEEKTLIAYLAGKNTLTALAILIALFTGVRLGELCALKWDDFNLTDKTIHIYKNLQRVQIPNATGKKTELKILTPKTESSIRDIPIPDWLLEQIKLHYKSKAYIVTGTEKYVDPRTMQNRFKKILQECGIADAGFHALRHSFATRGVELGFDPKSLSSMLGHSSVNTTFDRYVHPSMALKAENMKLLSDAYAVRFVVNECEEIKETGETVKEFLRPLQSTKYTCGIPLLDRSKFIEFLMKCMFAVRSVIMIESTEEVKEIFEWSDTDPDDYRKWCYAGGRRYLFADSVLEVGKGFHAYIHDIDLDAFNISDYTLEDYEIEYINNSYDDYEKAYAIADCIDPDRETGIFESEEALWEGIGVLLQGDYRK